MILIPAIDLIDGKCVRLSQGDYAQKKIYNENPLEVALEFEEAGIERLHLVDLDGAKAGKVINWKVLETLTSKTKLQIDFGGGVKTMDDLRAIFDSGALLATIGSLAAKKPNMLEEMVIAYGPNKFFIGADVKQEKIAVGGWLEQTDIWVYDFIRNLQTIGLQQFFCTDISKDGMLQGAATELYQQVLKECPGIELTASGGVSEMKDLHQLEEIGCTGAIVGKAIYEGRISTKDLTRFLTR